MRARVGQGLGPDRVRGLAVHLDQRREHLAQAGVQIRVGAAPVADDGGMGHGSRRYGVRGATVKSVRLRARLDPRERVVGEVAQRPGEREAVARSRAGARSRRPPRARSRSAAPRPPTAPARSRPARTPVVSRRPSRSTSRAARGGALRLALRLGRPTELERLRPGLEVPQVPVALAAHQAVRRGSEPDVGPPQPVDQVVARLGARPADVRRLVAPQARLAPHAPGRARRPPPAPRPGAAAPHPPARRRRAACPARG